MKLHQPGGIAFIILVIIVSVAATLIIKGPASGAVPQGNTNPVIEWVLIQLSPKIPGNAGVSITIQGYNFTATNNEVRSRGKVLATGLSAINRLAIGDSNIPGGSQRTGLNPSSAKIIVFELPAGIPCSSNEQCPLSVVNANGVSNTVTFRLSLPT